MFPNTKQYQDWLDNIAAVRGPDHLIETRHLFIALCGYPGSGKTTLADMMVEEDPVVTICDDGRPLRDAVKTLYGVTESDVTTQEGKARRIEVCGKSYTVRDLLGYLGDDIEARHGEGFLAEHAIRSADKLLSGHIIVCPSVRKSQGYTYRKAGGLVIEILRDGCEPTRPFDYYDKTWINVTIRNNGSKEELKETARSIVQYARQLLLERG